MFRCQLTPIFLCLISLNVLPEVRRQIQLHHIVVEVGRHWVLLHLPCLCCSLDYRDTMTLCVCEHIGVDTTLLSGCYASDSANFLLLSQLQPLDRICWLGAETSSCEKPEWNQNEWLSHTKLFWNASGFISWSERQFQINTSSSSIVISSFKSL